MKRVELGFLGLFLGMWGCVGLPVTDLDASATGGEASANATPGTGGATSAGGTTSTGGTSAGGTTSASGATSTGGTATTSSLANGNSASACSEVFTACGGDPAGTWDIIGVCVQGDLASVANTSYAADATQCSSLCTTATLAAQGSVTYNAGTVQPNAVLSLSETLQMTANCYAALFGTAWNSTSCAAVARTLDQQTGTTATCSAETAGCDCTYVTIMPASADTYTVDGTVLVASDGSTTEFCVQGSSMTQRDTLGNNTYAVTAYSKR